VGERDELAGLFEAQRGRLQGVAYRMLGSLSEAEDAVQEAWLRLQRADVSDVENLAGWLTTVVSRISLDMLRARAARREDLIGQEVPDAGWDSGQGGDPEQEAVLADSVGRALLVVLDTLAPDERIAFVLHDMFALPFDEIAPIVDRSPVTTKKLASRSRRKVRGTPAIGGAELARHRRVVEAFLAASRAGDVDAVLAVLAPDVARRADRAALAPGRPAEVRGACRVERDRGLRLERQVCLGGARQRRRRGGGRAARAAAARDRGHDRRREDHRVRAHRGPRPPSAAQPGRARRITGPGAEGVDSLSRRHLELAAAREASRRGAAGTSAGTG
jgi:RNA polymerase sigma factor (sigma-70 family)